MIRAVHTSRPRSARPGTRTANTHSGDPAPGLLSLPTHQSTGLTRINIYTPTDTCAHRAVAQRRHSPGTPARSAPPPRAIPDPGPGRASLRRGAQVEVVRARRVLLTLSPPASPGRVLRGRPSFLLPSAPPPPGRPHSPLFVLSVPPRPDPGPAAGRAGDARVTAGVCARLPAPLQRRSFARPGHSGAGPGRARGHRGAPRSRAGAPSAPPPRRPALAGSGT